MRVRLRNPNPSDAKRIYEIEVVSFNHPFSFLIILSQVILHGDTSLVAEVEGKVVGYAIAAKEVGNRLHLLNFAVDPQYRGLGIGSALLRALEKLAKRKGLKKIYLEVEEDNYRAIRLYRKAGFAEVKRMKNYYPWGKDAIVMVKELT